MLFNDKCNNCNRYNDGEQFDDLLNSINIHVVSGACPLHREAAAKPLKLTKCNTRDNVSPCITVWLHNYCVLENKYNGLRGIFTTMNDITKSWIINGDFAKAYHLLFAIYEKICNVFGRT